MNGETTPTIQQDIPTQTCTGCAVRLPLDRFRNDGRRAIGKAKMCIECESLKPVTAKSKGGVTVATKTTKKVKVVSSPLTMVTFTTKHTYNPKTKSYEKSRAKKSK